MKRQVELDDKKITRAMVERGLTTKMVAENYGISYQRTCALLNQKHATLGTIKKLAAAIGCEAIDIIAE